MSDTKNQHGDAQTDTAQTDAVRNEAADAIARAMQNAQANAQANAQTEASQTEAPSVEEIMRRRVAETAATRAQAAAILQGAPHDGPCLVIPNPVGGLLYGAVIAKNGGLYFIIPARGRGLHRDVWAQTIARAFAEGEVPARVEHSRLLIPSAEHQQEIEVGTLRDFRYREYVPGATVRGPGGAAVPAPFEPVDLFDKGTAPTSLSLIAGVTARRGLSDFGRAVLQKAGIFASEGFASDMQIDASLLTGEQRAVLVTEGLVRLQTFLLKAFPQYFTLSPQGDLAPAGAQTHVAEFIERYHRVIRGEAQAQAPAGAAAGAATDPMAALYAKLGLAGKS